MSVLVADASEFETRDGGGWSGAQETHNIWIKLNPFVHDEDVVFEMMMILCGFLAG